MREWFSSIVFGDLFLFFIVCAGIRDYGLKSERRSFLIKCWETPVSSVISLWDKWKFLNKVLQTLAILVRFDWDSSSSAFSILSLFSFMNVVRELLTRCDISWLEIIPDRSIYPYEMTSLPLLFLINSLLWKFSTNSENDWEEK